MKILKSIFLTLALLITVQNTAYSKTNIKKIGFTDSNRLYIQIDKKSKFKVFSLSNPHRIVVDVSNGSIRGLKKPKYIKNIKSVRFSSDSKKARIVFDLAKLIKVSSSSYTKLKGDKYGKITIVTSASTKPLRSKKRSAISRPIIVIDAGHGGKDPGALGRYLRTKEKIITLSYAKELYRTLKKSGKYKVYLTRDNDKFISLRNRVKKARKKKADLFISLHANSSTSRKTKGFSVYTLSEKASDKEAEKLAARENRAGGIGAMNFKNANADIVRTLIDLSQRNAMNHSSRFANLTINTVKKQKIKTIHNSHRFAGFAVLTAPDMVSILIELGYISNKTEEKNLNNLYHKRRIIKGIKSAIDEYFKFKN